MSSLPTWLITEKNVYFDAFRGNRPTETVSIVDGPMNKRKKAKVGGDSRVCISADSISESQPVVQLHIPSNRSYPLELNPEERNAEFLSNLLFPLSLNSFFDACFRKHAVHIQSNDSSRAQQIAETFLFSLDTEQILQHTSSENIFLWLRSDTSDSLQSVEISESKTAFLLHNSGSHAVYCRAPPTLEQIVVPALLEQTGLGCGQYDPTGEKSFSLGRGEVEVFIGTKGHVTNWHTDFQENFTIQLSGKKKWSLKRGTVSFPLRAITPHYHSPDSVESQLKSAKLSNPDFTWGLPVDIPPTQTSSTRAFGDEMDLIMNAGDILYFPAGMWHKVETIEEGISINISLMAMPYATLVCRALEHYLLRNSEWRETIWNRPTDDGSCPIWTKMDSLLENLDHCLTDFRRHGSACILPPILTFRSNSNNNKNEIISNDEMQSEEGDNTSYTNEDVVSVSQFIGPIHWSSQPPSKNHFLRRNQLATLIAMADIQSFYSSDKSPSPQEYPIYVLNCNYAGNESHESVVRVLLQDDTEEQSLAKFCQWESMKTTSGPELKQTPSCLIYYGYLIWSEGDRP